MNSREQLLDTADRILSRNRHCLFRLENRTDTLYSIIETVLKIHMSDLTLMVAELHTDTTLDGQYIYSAGHNLASVLNQIECILMRLERLL